MDILRATKLKYGAIHSADPKQMCLCQKEIKQNPVLQIRPEAELIKICFTNRNSYTN